MSESLSLLHRNTSSSSSSSSYLPASSSFFSSFFSSCYKLYTSIIDYAYYICHCCRIKSISLSSIPLTKQQQHRLLLLRSQCKILYNPHNLEHEKILLLLATAAFQQEWKEAV